MFDYIIFSILIILEHFLLRSLYKKIKRDEPDRYFTLVELGGKSVLNHIFKYIVFRISPVFIISILNYKILPILDERFYIIIFNSVLVFVEIWSTNLRAFRKYYMVTNTAYWHLLVVFLMSFIPYMSDLTFPYLVKFTPSGQGIIDSIWSALIIFGLASLFLNFFNKKYIVDDSSYYLEKNHLLKVIEKFIPLIEEESKKYNANPDLVKSIAIYESLQRPKPIRFFEKLFVFISRKPVSQGIMQFKTNKIISDKESISLSIKNYFKDSSKKVGNYEDVESLLSKYSVFSKYALQIYFIFNKLKK